MSDFRFGELGERALHKQLKALFRPEDGEAEWPVGKAIADLWSPTEGVIEIQTRRLGKLLPKVTQYLSSGLRVTVVHPLAVHKTIITWNADRTEVQSRSKSPKRERIEGAFREIGTLAPVLVTPGFRLILALVRETEHRCDDGQGSWRRQGKSKIDRVLDEVVDQRIFVTRQDYAQLLPTAWADPGTAADLAATLGLPPAQTQPLVSCLKKLGILEVCGLRGRAHLLRRAPSHHEVTAPSAMA